MPTRSRLRLVARAAALALVVVLAASTAVAHAQTFIVNTELDDPDPTLWKRVPADRDPGLDVYRVDSASQLADRDDWAPVSGFCVPLTLAWLKAGKLEPLSFLDFVTAPVDPTAPADAKLDGAALDFARALIQHPGCDGGEQLDWVWRQLAGVSDQTPVVAADVFRRAAPPPTDDGKLGPVFDQIGFLLRLASAKAGTKVFVAGADRAFGLLLGASSETVKFKPSGGGDDRLHVVNRRIMLFDSRDGSVQWMNFDRLIEETLVRGAFVDFVIREGK